MRHARLLGPLSLFVVAAALGCSSESEGTGPGVTPDSTAETSAETSTDTATPDTADDAGEETSDDTGSAETSDDTGSTDVAETSSDAPLDTSVVDADAAVETGVDVGVDVASDAAPDAVDASDADALPPPALPAAEVWVVRVGTGTAALTNAATETFIDKYKLPEKTLLGSIALPTAASGSNKPFTLAGTSTSIGFLLRSMDEKYVTLFGYGATPGTLAVEGTDTTGASPVLRVVARVDKAGTIDTSTSTTSYAKNSPRAAITKDGTQYWVAGEGLTTKSEAIGYIGTHGGSGDVVGITTGLGNGRSLNIIEGALFGTTASGTTLRIFDFAGALPTTATTPTNLPGGPTSGGSPYGVVGFKLGTGSTIDTVYVCDDRDPPNGGIQKYRKGVDGNFSLAATFNAGITKGCRGLTGFVSGTDVVLLAVTGENPSRLVAYQDLGGIATTAIVDPIATAATNTHFRGTALAPK